MLHAKTMKATLAILAGFFLASVGYSQVVQQRPPTYMVPGDHTVYTIAPSPRELDATNLVPVADSSSPKSKTPEPKPISYFHLEFVVKMLDGGKATGSRTYTMDANTDTEHHYSPNYQTSFRSDIQRHPSAAENARTHDQTNIDCDDLSLVGTDSVSMWVTASIDSSGPSMDTSYKVTFDPTVTLGKPTVVFSSDGPTPNSKIEMEVTATPIHLNLTAKP